MFLELKFVVGGERISSRSGVDSVDCRGTDGDGIAAGLFEAEAAMACAPYGLSRLSIHALLIAGPVFIGGKTGEEAPISREGNSEDCIRASPLLAPDVDGLPSCWCCTGTALCCPAELDGLEKFNPRKSPVGGSELAGPEVSILLDVDFLLPTDVTSSLCWRSLVRGLSTTRGLSLSLSDSALTFDSALICLSCLLATRGIGGSIGGARPTTLFRSPPAAPAIVVPSLVRGGGLSPLGLKGGDGRAEEDVVR